MPLGSGPEGRARGGNRTAVDEFRRRLDDVATTAQSKEGHDEVTAQSRKYCGDAIERAVPKAELVD